ncbi:hypothetical protein PG996_004757 [Apiospora saccharicola]|uniref:Uncharacterized protein n=1 Tax=Apiospora saccharicola TaxID=335842 RepID=A0ABR1W518_9PEZI
MSTKRRAATSPLGNRAKGTRDDVYSIEDEDRVATGVAGLSPHPPTPELWAAGCDSRLCGDHHLDRLPLLVTRRVQPKGE